MALQHAWYTDELGKQKHMKYEVIPGVLMMMGVRRRDWPSVFADLKLMEKTVLEEHE